MSRIAFPTLPSRLHLQPFAVSFLIATTLLLTGAPTFGQDDNDGPRTWTSKNGKFKIEAELITVDGGEIELRRSNGKTIKLEFDKLSTADREFIQEWQEEKRAEQDLTDGKSQPKDRRFKYDDFVSIAVPDVGFNWKVKRTSTTPDGTKISMLEAKGKGGRESVTVTIMHDATPQNQKYKATVSFILGFRDSIQKRAGKLSDFHLKASQPPKDLNKFGLSFDNESGGTTFIEGTNWFGKSHHFVVYGQALDKDRARELAQVFMSIEELDAAGNVNQPVPVVETEDEQLTDNATDADKQKSGKYDPTGNRRSLEATEWRVAPVLVANSNRTEFELKQWAVPPIEDPFEKRQIFFSENGQFAAYAIHDPFKKKMHLIRIDLNDNQAIVENHIQTRDDEVLLALTKDGSRAVSARGSFINPRLNFWELPGESDGKLSASWSMADSDFGFLPTAAHFLSAERLVTAGKHLVMWNLDKEIAEFSFELEQNDKPGFAVSPDQKYLAVSKANQVFLIQHATGEVDGQFDVSDSVKEVTFSPDGKSLAFTTRKTLGVYNLVNQELAIEENRPQELAFGDHQIRWIDADTLLVGRKVALDLNSNQVIRKSEFDIFGGANQKFLTFDETDDMIRTVNLPDDEQRPLHDKQVSLDIEFPLSDEQNEKLLKQTRDWLYENKISVVERSDIQLTSALGEVGKPHQANITINRNKHKLQAVTQYVHLKLKISGEEVVEHKIPITRYVDAERAEELGIRPDSQLFAVSGQLELFLSRAARELKQ
jgi:WD40 repeat protein